MNNRESPKLNKDKKVRKRKIHGRKVIVTER